MKSPSNGSVAVDAADFTALTRIGSGGTADILSGMLSGTPVLFKRYHSENIAQVDFSAMADLVRFPSTLDAAARERLLRLCAWPTAVVYEGGSPVGILMRPAGQEFMLQRRGKVEPRHLTALGTAEPVAVRQQREYFEMSHKLARLGQLLLDLRFLHRQQIVVGDLQPKNILTTGPGIPGSPGPVQNMLLDCDSFSLRGRSPQAALDPLPYKAPDASLAHIQGLPQFTVRSDLYKFALVAIRCMAEDFGAVEIEIEHFAEFVTPGDLRQLGAFLEGNRIFSDADIEEMGLGWRACVAPDGRLWMRSGMAGSRALPVENPAIAPVVTAQPSRARLVAVAASVIVILVCVVVAVVYLAG